MVKKKRTIQRDNNIAVLVQEEKEREERRAQKLRHREDLRRERREELVSKLQKVADTLNGAPTASSSAAQPGAGDADVDMASSVSKRKQHGVIRKIGKHKKGAKATGKVKASKALLKAARDQGVLPSIKYARRVLEGKKKPESKPDGQERKRDRILRRAREKRERRGPKNKGEQEEGEEEAEEEDDDE
mmetsp:Transcript_129577/g.402989  ORF Transcript_129577/g.402989 Transcript_129577/m.402989 type:complete len:188 (-) Transcript_129577:46-609(-)|eukprot:CAMPEP_0204564224 /NCGR_PEP_ID=MMETSP0661-20131031/34758_1 /ASSEMBLY_ACC=CAM_ASM_000606 /TAXON_ID=109239 /ORGANISM="Alexandrium margalefi, Strain AMGDE01CS-322" /LENGTH=187 /DNA_ID=CAMNT_0051571851 /DNA_START=74 /DNA_END=637 /DNA_ORIENTATION=+